MLLAAGPVKCRTLKIETPRDALVPDKIKSATEPPDVEATRRAFEGIAEEINIEGEKKSSNESVRGMSRHR